MIQPVGGLLTIGSANFAILVAFYTAILGQAPVTQMSGYAEFQLPGVRLGIFLPRLLSSGESGGVRSSTAGMALCLEVVDLEAAIAHFTTLGYPPTGPIQVAAHGREISATDPDGNSLILHQS